MSRQPDFRTTGGAPKGGSAPNRARDWRLALLAALLLVWSGTAAWSAHERLAYVQRANERARLEAADADRRVREKASRPDAAQAELSARARLTRDAPPPRVLADLEALLPPGARLRQVSATYASRLELQLEVTARRAQDYDRFLDRLSGSALFDAVTTGPENRDGEVRATVRAVYLPGGAR